MRVLLDTHVLLWWVAADHRLSKATAAIIADGGNAIAVSAVSFWEIAIKKTLGRIDIDIQELAEKTRRGGFEELPVQFIHAARLAALPAGHNDPFDRMLIAQAIVESRQLLTRDKTILGYAGITGFAPLRA